VLITNSYDLFDSVAEHYGSIAEIAVSTHQSSAASQCHGFHKTFLPESFVKKHVVFPGPFVVIANGLFGQS
jgi:hypothetical protein